MAHVNEVTEESKRETFYRGKVRVKGNHPRVMKHAGKQQWGLKGPCDG